MARSARIAGGILLLIVGLILMLPFVPGPGIALVLLALAMLSRDFVWAKNAMEWVKRKIAPLRPGKMSDDEAA